MSKALINPINITWARERAGMDVPTLAEKMHVDGAKVLKWERGEDQPTFSQARKIAQVTLVSFGRLFSKKTPEDLLPIPDLRTLDSNGVAKPSAALLKVLHTVLERRDWYREYRLENMNNDGRFRTNFSLDSRVEDIVQDMKDKLHLDGQRRGKWEEYQRKIVNSIEDFGILLMREADLGHFTRPLRVEEFRGFALFDDIAPVIFVNGADAPAAQLFTIIHELAHIWIGQSGVSDVSTHNHRREEVLCNAVAAEFLVPENEFFAMWETLDSWTQNLPGLEAHFHVSRWVLARRAFSLGLIDESEYRQFIAILKRQYEQNKKEGPVPYYRVKANHLGRNFSKAVVSEALSGRVLLRDAGHLLDIKPFNIKKLATELGIPCTS